MKKLLLACFICVFLVSGCSLLPDKEKKQETAPQPVQKVEETPAVEIKTTTAAPVQPAPVIIETTKIKRLIYTLIIANFHYQQYPQLQIWMRV